MSGFRQRTISREATLDGVGVHCGEPASVTFRGAKPGAGVLFRRMDIEDAPEIPATVAQVVDTDRGTTLGAGGVTVRTVEHVLAAVVALEIDNLVISVDGPEVPIRDGSFADFVAALEGAGPVEQEAEALVLRLREPLAFEGPSNQSYAVTPADGLAVSATIDFRHELIGRQSISLVIDAETFRKSVAPARTFGFQADAEVLRARGLALGASLDNTVVLSEGGIMNDGLRFEDEFVRHKIGDLLGDLALLGARMQAHIVAERPSHAGNVALVRLLAAHLR
jgi:UDP-3-O-acyl N-acetylglucosamine deacetylase